MVILDGTYSDEKNQDGNFIYPDQINELTKYVQRIESNVKRYNGTLEIQDGIIINDNFTVIHLRSVAEGISIKGSDKNLFNGVLAVADGRLLTLILFQLNKMILKSH